MSVTTVKICGITTPEMARQCYGLGADYLGMIFAPSPRRIAFEQAGQIRAAVPDARLVGVFMDATTDEVLDAVDVARLDLVQLHGRETPGYCAALRERGSPPLIKALTPGRSGDTTGDRIDMSAYAAVDYFLFDLVKGSAASTSVLDGLWTTAAAASREGYEVFLAGALNPDNVATAVVRAQPFGVDVCSGVEREPGVKDLDTVKRFLAEVNSA